MRCCCCWEAAATVDGGGDSETAESGGGMIEECGELVGRDKYSDADGWYAGGIEFCERQKVASSRLLHVDLASYLV